MANSRFYANFFRCLASRRENISFEAARRMFSNLSRLF